MRVTPTLLPSKVGVTKGLMVPFFHFASPSPGPSPNMPTQRDPSVSETRLTIWPLVRYVSETPSCQWTSAVDPPSQNPPLPSANKELLGAIGIPSSLPKHFRAWCVTWQRGESKLDGEPPPTPNEPSGSSLMF